MYTGHISNLSVVLYLSFEAIVAFIFLQNLVDGPVVEKIVYHVELNIIWLLRNRNLNRMK